MDKRFLIPIVFLTVVLAALGGILVYSQIHREPVVQEVPTITQPPSYSMPFSVGEENNGQQHANISSATPQPKRALIQLKDALAKRPNAFQIKATYNKNDVDVVELKVGDLWSDANVLTSVVDPDNGVIKFAAGQGFNAKEGKGQTLFSVRYKSKPNKSGILILTVYPESKLGFVGQQGLTSLDPSTLTVVSEQQ